MRNHAPPRANSIAALTLVGAALVAAFFTHVGIDLAGDVVLAHDTYDGLDHGSRNGVCAVALGLAIAALMRVVWLALEEARTGRSTDRPALDDVFGSGPLGFAGAVVALTLPALMTMEFIDIIADGRRFAGVVDLLGGSAWLGLGMTVAVAALVGLVVRSIVQLAMGSHRALVTVLRLFFALLTQTYPRIDTRRVTAGWRLRLRRRSILSQRSGKRGPPLRLA